MRVLPRARHVPEIHVVVAGAPPAKLNPNKHTFASSDLDPENAHAAADGVSCGRTVVRRGGAARPWPWIAGDYRRTLAVSNIHAAVASGGRNVSELWEK